MPKKVKGVWNPDAYIKSHLRKIWRWSPQRRECLKGKSCVVCGKKAAKLYADHISPVVDPLKGFEGWETYISRLFNGKLQAICDPCHKVKSKAENAQRRLTKKKLKESK